MAVIAELHEVAAGAELEVVADRGGGRLRARHAAVSGSGCGVAILDRVIRRIARRIADEVR